MTSLNQFHQNGKFDQTLLRLHGHITSTHTAVEMQRLPSLGPSHKVGESRMTAQHTTMKLIATTVFPFRTLGQTPLHLLAKLLNLCNTHTRCQERKGQSYHETRTAHSVIQHKKRKLWDNTPTVKYQPFWIVKEVLSFISSSSWQPTALHLEDSATPLQIDKVVHRPDLHQCNRTIPERKRYSYWTIFYTMRINTYKVL